MQRILSPQRLAFRRAKDKSPTLSDFSLKLDPATTSCKTTAEMLGSVAAAKAADRDGDDHHNKSTLTGRKPRARP